MRDVTFRPLSLPACLVCTLDASSSVQSFPEPDTTISNKFSEHECFSYVKLPRLAGLVGRLL
jgi:hypothetical protein